MINFRIIGSGLTLIGFVLSAGRPAAACGKGYAKVPPQMATRYTATHGTYLEAFQIAYQDWKAHISRGRFKLRNQTVTFEPNGSDLEVRIIPKRGGLGTLGGSTPFGVETLYVIDQHNLRIVCRSLEM